jgi:hypothetical protein
MTLLVGASDASDASHSKSPYEEFNENNSENTASDPGQNAVQDLSSELVVKETANNRDNSNDGELVNIIIIIIIIIIIQQQQEFWALYQLYDLPLVYQQLKNDFDSFFELFKLLKKNKMLSKQHILKILRYAGHDLPLLENKIRKLTNDIIELEIRKKDLNNTIILQRAQLSDLGQAIIRYQNAIDIKKQDFMTIS